MDAVISISARLRGSHLDSAHAVTIDDGDADVTLLAPVGTPRVLNLVVGCSIGVDAIADGQNTMVKLGATVSSDNTSSVSLENLLVGLDGDRHWAFSDGCLESF